MPLNLESAAAAAAAAAAATATAAAAAAAGFPGIRVLAWTPFESSGLVVLQMNLSASALSASTSGKPAWPLCWTPRLQSLGQAFEWASDG